MIRTGGYRPSDERMPPLCTLLRGLAHGPAPTHGKSFDMPSVYRPRCMLHHAGASYLVEATVPSIEQSGSDNLRTPILRFPRRPGVPAKQRDSPGSGPAGPENFGYFPSLESSPPAGGISPKTKQRFRRCGGEFLSERSERNQRIAGGIVRKESAAAAPCAFAHDSPGPPFYGRARGVRRQSRPARCPHEGCLTVITAVLLS